MPNLKDAAHGSRFEGKVVLVAGVGPGAGLATAMRFGLEGARVVAVARTEGSIERAEAALTMSGIDHRTGIADVATDAGASRAVQTAVDAFGGIDALVCTAGGYAGGDLAGTDGALLDRMLDTNLRAAFHASKAAAPELEKRGRGAIVITTAVFGAVVPGPGLLAYNTSKGAATAFILSLAGDLAPKNIRVNGILPGAISHQLDPDQDASASRELLRGPAFPHDIAAAATFLASDEACWISGATLVVDGGFSVSRKPF